MPLGTVLGFAVALLLVAIFLQRQVAHQLPDAVVPQLIVLWAASALAGICIAGLHSGQAVPDLENPASTRSHPWAWAVAAVAVLCALVSAWLVARDPWNAQWLWLLAMALPVAALVVSGAVARRRHGAGDTDTPHHARWAWRRSDGGQPPRRGASWQRFLRFREAVPGTEDHAARSAPFDLRDVAIGTGLFVGSLGVRAYDITRSPPFVHGDEASCGLFGRLFNGGHVPLLSIGWFGLPMTSYAYLGAGMRIFGDSVSGLRLTNAVVGSLGIVLTYLLGKEWFGRRAGLLGAAVLSVTFLHMAFSRDGIHNIQAPTAVTLTLLLVTLWLRYGGALTALLSGMSVMLDLQVYWGARVGPILVLLLLAIRFIQDRGLWSRRRAELAWCCIGIAVSGAAIAGLYRANPGTFSGRENAVSIFVRSPLMQDHLRSAYGTTDLLTVIPQQLWRNVSTFNVRIDAGDQIGLDGPMFDFLTAALLPAALMLAVLRIRRWQYLIALLWFGGVLAGGVFSVDPPWWPRLFTFMPAVAMLLGVLISDLSLALQRWMGARGSASLLGACLVGIIAVVNLQTLFVSYPAYVRQGQVMEPTMIARFLAQQPGSWRAVLFSDDGLRLDDRVIQFVAPQAGGCTLVPAQALTSCPGSTRSRVFVAEPGEQARLDQARALRPGGRIVQVGEFHAGGAVLYAYITPG